MDDEIDATNEHMVSVNGKGEILLLNPPVAPLTRERALVLAAWIVTLCDPAGKSFSEYTDAVQNT